MLGLLLLIGLLAAGGLAIVGVGYLAVRRHFHEIPLSRSNAIGISSLLSAGMLAAWLSLGIFGYVFGQSLGNGNLGSLIGGLLGIAFWILTTAFVTTRDGLRTLALVFLVLPAIVYAVLFATGWTAAWVYRGFRGDRTRPPTGVE